MANLWCQKRHYWYFYVASTNVWIIKMRRMTYETVHKPCYNESQIIYMQFISKHFKGEHKTATIIHFLIVKLLNNERAEYQMNGLSEVSWSIYSWSKWRAQVELNSSSVSFFGITWDKHPKFGPLPLQTHYASFICYTIEYTYWVKT